MTRDLPPGAPAGRGPAMLRPALALTDRLRTSARLLTLVTVTVLPGIVATWSFAGVMDQQVAFAGSERDGVAVVRPALTAMTEAVAGRPVDLSAVESAVAAHPALEVQEQLAAVRDAAEKAGGDDPAARAVLVQSLASLVGAVGDSSNLILDPDLDSFYVMDAQVVQLPKILVTAAQAAAPSPGTMQERVAAQAVAAGTLQSASESVATDVATAAEHTASADLEQRLAPVGALAASGKALADRLTATLARPGPADEQRTAAVAQAAAQAVGPLAATLDELLVARTDGLSQRRNATLTVTVAGMALACWLAASVWWRTRRDVTLTVGAVTRINEGDLRPSSLPVGRDEFGDIGRALDAAREQLLTQREALEQAQAERLDQARRSVEQQRVAAEEVRRRAQSVIDDTARLVTSELTEVTAQVDGVRRAAGTIDERVSAADHATRDVVEQAREADRVVAELGGSLQQVAGMAQLIAGVADQTRLLALNATIEAARAGEAGRGFSVVADEVKNLAMTTARSTDQITSTITTLERDARAVSAAIARMSAGIGGVDEATEVLAGVATEQHALVERLDRSVVDAIGRVSGMSDLTERL